MILLSELGIRLSLSFFSVLDSMSVNLLIRSTLLDDGIVADIIVFVKI